jgi:hypothetical protein
VGSDAHPYDVPPILYGTPSYTPSAGVAVAAAAATNTAAGAFIPYHIPFIEASSFPRTSGYVATPDLSFCTTEEDDSDSTAHMWSANIDPFLEYQTFAPVFNPPASTSLLQNVGPAAKTPEETASEEFVHGLLIFQKSDGCFAFGNESTVKKALGPSFLSVVIGLKANLDVFDTVVTVALVALLEEQFQICQALWVLMVQKARDYISACSLGPTADVLMQEARGYMKSIPLVMQEIKDAESAAATAIELEIAPIV